MIARLLFPAILVGMLAGLVATAAQQWRAVPLILHAETYETAATSHDHEEGAASHNHAAAPAEGDDEAVGRFLGTLGANLVIGVGFALLLAGASLAFARPITLQNGLLWGLAGFAAISAAPALGLPPELPGMPAADLVARQLWWLFAVATTGLGLAVIAFARPLPVRLLGIALLIVPHLVPAPHPESLESAVPAALAAEFVVASLASTALFWIVLGLGLGFVGDRALGARGQAGAPA